MHDRNEMRGFVRENTTVVNFHGDMKPLNGGSRSWSSLLKGIKGKIFFYLNYLLVSDFHGMMCADLMVVGRGDV